MLINYIQSKLKCFLINKGIAFDPTLFDYSIVIITRYTSCIVIALIGSYILNTTNIFLCFIPTFYLLRIHFGGLHLNSNFACLVFSIAMFLAIPFLIKCIYTLISISISFMLISSLVYIVFFYINCPIDHENKRLNIKEKKYHKKRGILNTIIIMSLYIILPYEISVSLFFAVTFEMLNCLIAKIYHNILHI